MHWGPQTHFCPSFDRLFYTLIPVDTLWACRTCKALRGLSPLSAIGGWPRCKREARRTHDTLYVNGHSAFCVNSCLLMAQRGNCVDRCWIVNKDLLFDQTSYLKFYYTDAWISLGTKYYSQSRVAASGQNTPQHRVGENLVPRTFMLTGLFTEAGSEGCITAPGEKSHPARGLSIGMHGQENAARTHYRHNRHQRGVPFGHVPTPILFSPTPSR
jgi:hypothetical protein